MTTPERWQEIDRLFAAALECEPDKRTQFLVQACAGDDELRKEVESLLAHDSTGSLVGTPAVEEATRLLSHLDSNTLANKTIGPYKMSRSLGVGGMGQVYLAHDARLNRPVAVKLLSFYDATDEERLRRFRQEALAASALNHPNILTIYEIGEFEEHNYLVTEFVEGQTLHNRIHQGPVSVDSAVDIAIQVGNALSAAHAAGIVHRDVKPANIMLRPDGLVKVLDFGIAKYAHPDGLEEQHTMLQTTPGSIVGTVTYMSPEQARGTKVDARTDIWSLGVILFEMVSGQRPFVGDTSLDVMAAIVQRDPPSLVETGTIVPEAFQKIVTKSLQKSVNQRYQTANELLDDLKVLKKSLEQGEELAPVSARLGVADSHPSSEGPVSENQIDKRTSETPDAEPTHHITVPRRTLAVAGLLVVLLIGAVAYWAYTRSPFEARSIAVLPFKNETGNSDLEYLADGMTESLINSLAQIPQVTVKASTSVFRYKNSPTDPQRIASELSVDTVLNGRLVQRGDELTLYLSLVDVRNGNQVWGDQYDRKLSDVLLLQREIARDVSQKLRVKLSGATVERVTKDYTSNTEAYRLYLRGRFHIHKLTQPEVELGIENLEKAIEIDPNYALAYVGLSAAYRSLALGSEISPKEFLGKSKVAALTALQFDGELGEAHGELATAVFWLDRNWTMAENEFRRALELNPNIAEAHVFYAHLLSNMGRHNESMVEIKRARELDPLSPYIGALEGQFLLHAGNPDAALARLKDTSALAPNFWFPHLFASSAYIEKGMYAEAVAEARSATELSPHQTASAAYGGYALAKMGQRDEARAVLNKLLVLGQQRFVPPIHIALLYNALGEREQTFIWLERAFEVGDPKLTFLKVEPKWNNLRDDKKFQDLMRRVGF